MSYPSYEDSVEIPKPTPRPKPAAPTFSPPDHIARDVRKFALSQAVKALGTVRLGTALVDIAAEFEDYVMNGKKEDK